MPPAPIAGPAFGQADLSNCEREQIHLAGSIQPHGALLLLREPELTVVQASANAAAFLGLAGPLTGCRLGAFGAGLEAAVRHCLDEAPPLTPASLRWRVGAPAASFDALLHRPAGGGVVIELERAGPPVDLAGPIEAALLAILAAHSLRTLGDETARIFRDLTGYDRVMVYRFDEDGHGEVFAERRRADLEAFLGNRYPASDIPHIARRLYERSRVRVLVDAAYEPVPLVPALSPLSGAELDMSLCWLRSMSPIHVQYMKNMGVAATLVASLLVGGRLWGLIACHHDAPRLPHIALRTACDLLAEAVATRIAALESFVQAQAELSVRRLEQRLIEAIPRDGDWRNALFDTPQTLLQPVGAGGAALLFEGQVLTAGEVPGTQQLRALGAWLDERPRGPAFATATLGQDAPEFGPLAATASGLLAIALSAAPLSAASHAAAPHSAVPHSAVPHSAVPHSAVPHSAVPHSAVPHSAVPHSAVPHSAVPHSAVPHSAVPHSAVPHSAVPGDYLMWFRPERVRTVTWGGNPFKPALPGDDPGTLSPRRSFAQWHQLVEGTSDPWTQADRAAARLIGDTVADVVLQFRSVHMLIAQSQLDDVRRQVGQAEQPVLIADPTGRILLGNDAFRRMLPEAGDGLHRLDDLPAWFAEPAEVRLRLHDVMTHRHTWRGEVRLAAGTPPRALLVRADPVFSAPGRVLGFVFLFTDLSERKAAEAARRRFQDSVVERSRSQPRHADPAVAMLYRQLMASVVENAHLAALEITDGLDMLRMAELLESVRGSVARAADVLEHLIHQSHRASGHDGDKDA